MSDVRGGEGDKVLACLVVVLGDVVGGFGECGNSVCVLLDSNTGVSYLVVSLCVSMKIDGGRETYLA